MTEFNRILVPLDGSSPGEKALPVATTLAEKFESTIILLRVLDIPTPSTPVSHPEVTIDWVIEARRYALQEAESYLNVRQGLGFVPCYVIRHPPRTSSMWLSPKRLT